MSAQNSGQFRHAFSLLPLFYRHMVSAWEKNTKQLFWFLCAKHCVMFQPWMVTKHRPGLCPLQPQTSNHEKVRRMNENAILWEVPKMRDADRILGCIREGRGIQSRQEGEKGRNWICWETLESKNQRRPELQASGGPNPGLPWRPQQSGLVDSLFWALPLKELTVSVVFPPLKHQILKRKKLLGPT